MQRLMQDTYIIILDYVIHIFVSVERLTLSGVLYEKVNGKHKIMHLNEKIMSDDAKG
jgi:hypothetical protein